MGSDSVGVRKWILILKWILFWNSQRQCPVSRTQRPNFSVQSPESRLQRSESKVQRPESTVQSPASNTSVQSPGIVLCPSNLSKHVCTINANKRNVCNPSSVSQFIKRLKVSKPICSSNTTKHNVCNASSASQSR